MTVWLENDRYVWEQRLEINFPQDLDTAELHAQAPLRVYRFPHRNLRRGIFFQFADPMPCGASGPAVPMIRDWGPDRGPYTGPEGFTRRWKRRWFQIIFQNPDGSYSWSDLHKWKWFYLTLDNRTARLCHPQGSFYLLKADGSGLEYQVDAPSHYHHVCEWGMDFHCWADLEPSMEGTVIPAGTRIEANTTARLVGPEVIEPLLEQAQEICLTEAEHRKAYLPAYEEPENTLTASVLDEGRMDAWRWEPTSEGCRWEKTGGHREGTGCLVIENDYSMSGRWEQVFTGSSQWGNPFVPGAHYRLSAWVKVENADIDTWERGPQVGALFASSTPWPFENPSKTLDCGWSEPLVDVDKPAGDRIDWTYVELITPPGPEFASYCALRLQFCGRGTACFSGVRWARVEE